MTTTVRRTSPALYAGPEAWSAVVAELREPCVVVVDDGFAKATADLPVNSFVRLKAGDDDAASIANLIEVLAIEAPTTVIAIGGGSVLDRVKLACLDPAARAAVMVRGRRAGVVALPPTKAALPRRVFVPTTIGTGVEVSQVACTMLAGRRRLVTGPALRPDVAVLDPRFTATLPSHLLREGVFEALMRVIGPAIGDNQVDDLGDAEAATLTAQLMLVGERLARGETGPDTRLAAATLSATTHTGWALARRAPFSAKHWYLANELSVVLGVSKIAATASVLLPVWSRIAAGDRRFGHPERLAEVWRWITCVVPDLGTDPVDGVSRLLRRWAVEPATRISGDACVRAAGYAVESWGGPLPMLARLSVAELEMLYRDAGREVMVCST